MEVRSAWRPSVPGELPPIFCENCIQTKDHEVRHARTRSSVWKCARCGMRLDLP